MTKKIGDMGTLDLKRVSEMIRTIHDNNIHPQIIVWISSIPAAHHVQTRNVTPDSVGFSTSTSSPSEGQVDDDRRDSTSTNRDSRKTEIKHEKNSNQSRYNFMATQYDVCPHIQASVNGIGYKKKEKIHLKSRQPDDSHPSCMIHNTNFESPFPS